MFSVAWAGSISMTDACCNSLAAVEGRHRRQTQTGQVCGGGGRGGKGGYEWVSGGYGVGGWAGIWVVGVGEGAGM